MASGNHLRDHLEVDESVFSLDACLSEAGASVDHLSKVTEDWLREGRGGWGRPSAR